ncbi:MAG: hypothetical protein U9N49_03720 [Campylobacterota bacterium]|nr:hypothetical protein [Campylobacterota bacterium]
MKYLSIKEQKIELIEKIFTPLLGQSIQGYSIVELFDEEYDEWDLWHELPIRLSIGEASVSISWEKFDDLALSPNDEIDENWNEKVMRWAHEGIEPLDSAKGQKIVGVAMARYPKSEFWNRLLLYLDNDNVLDIYNALDENAYALYSKSEIEGEVVEILSS